MSNPENLSLLGQRLLNRRNFLGTAGLSASGLGLASILNTDGLLADVPKTAGGEKPIRPSINPHNPYAGREAHFDVPAKQVLVIYLPGAISHVDTFDYKPALGKLHGQKPPNLPKLLLKGLQVTLRNHSGTSSLMAKPVKWFQIYFLILLNK